MDFFIVPPGHIGTDTFWTKIVPRKGYYTTSRTTCYVIPCTRIANYFAQLLCTLCIFETGKAGFTYQLNSEWMISISSIAVVMWPVSKFWYPSRFLEWITKPCTSNFVQKFILSCSCQVGQKLTPESMVWVTWPYAIWDSSLSQSIQLVILIISFTTSDYTNLDRLRAIFLTKYSKLSTWSNVVKPVYKTGIKADYAVQLRIKFSLSLSLSLSLSFRVFTV